MPRKRNIRKLKQMKIIKTRLMEISLKMDNYIYKNRPISMNEAQIYYRDVISYKDQCGDNARILQVIDKLKHQLKALIEESQDSADYYNVHEIIENSITSLPLSPTYSMDSDERIAPSNQEQHEMDNNITINGPSNTMDTIDLCSDEKIDETILIQTEEPNDQSSVNIKHIERSFSNLTVKTDNATQVENLVENTIDDIQKTKETPKTKKPRKQKTGTRVHCNKTVTIDKLVNGIKENNEPKRKRRSNKAQENDSKTKEMANPKKPRKQKTCTPKDTTKDILVNNNHTESVHPPHNAINNNLIKPTDLLLKSREFETHPVNVLYNSNVENDLSWVENNRYIREVAPDEIDPKLTYLDQSFWQTLELPSNWNDQDFLY